MISSTITGFEWGNHRPCNVVKVRNEQGFFRVVKSVSVVPSKEFDPRTPTLEVISTILNGVCNPADCGVLYLDNQCFVKHDTDSTTIADIFEGLGYKVERFDKSPGVVEQRKKVYDKVVAAGKVSSHGNLRADLLSCIIYEFHKGVSNGL